MYSSPPMAGTIIVAGGTLASTGLNVLWIPLGGFALLSAGLALLRLVPRRES
jgi:hypothetical protein